MSVVMEGGAVSAAAVGFARMRPRRARVRRDPIDVELIAAEFAEFTEPQRRSEQEIIAALEAEVQRVNSARVRPDQPLEPVLESEPPDPDPVYAVSRATPEVDISAAPNVTAQLAHDAIGLPLEQVRAWLEQVKEDLRKVQARVEYLQLEQSRLLGQHHLVAELISSTTPV